MRYLRAVEPAEAEDLAAEVWFGIAKQANRFQGDETGLRALVFTIARRRVIDIRRRRLRHRTDPVPPDRLADLVGASHTETDTIELLEGQRAVDLLARRLPQAQADVLRLRVIGGLEVAHVARLLGRSPGSVRVLHHRALKRLRA